MASKKRKKSRRKNPEIGCYTATMANPRTHIPPLKGRGRPAKKRRISMTTKLANGMTAKRKLHTTMSAAKALAQRIVRKRYHGSSVVRVILDDGKK